MSKHAQGNLSGLSPSQIRRVERLFHRKLDREELVSPVFARELYQVAVEVGRRIGALVSREGRIEEIIVGSREILYLPDLGRYRLSQGRLRRLRLVFSDLTKGDGEPQIPHDIYTDLEKLRFDAVISVKETAKLQARYAHIIPLRNEEDAPVDTIFISDLFTYQLHFPEFITELEGELSKRKRSSNSKEKAFLVGVYEKQYQYSEQSLEELRELASSAGVEIAGELVQKRSLDPKTLVGKGKLEEIILRCLRLEADILIFDTELKPSQWRIITNMTDLKVLDRSMLILDIFAQRASSSDGRLQVELAQLKYNLPRLVEKDVGLSRLTGGIGGRGPGETKLEVGRRRIRDRIADLERRIQKLGKQRNLRRQRRKGVPLPLLAIVGYTNAGKSTLFNALTKGSAFEEDKLFATLDPTQGRFVLPTTEEDDYSYGNPVVLIDTVGFIRDLPDELRNAFRATLEELREADLFLHVVDGSDERASQQIASVEEVLKDMELVGVPRLVIFNKCDRAPASSTPETDLPHVQVSAIKRIGLDELRYKLAEILPEKKNSTEYATSISSS